MLRRAETILFILLACGIFLLTYLQLNQTFFIYGLAQLLLYFLFALAIIYAAYKVIKDRRPLPLSKKIKPLLFGIFLVPVFFLISWLADTDGGKRNIISASHNGDLNFMRLGLLTDIALNLFHRGRLAELFIVGSINYLMTHFK
jgi:hypothetical protein